MLEDLASTPASVSLIVPWSNQSPIERSWRARDAGTVRRVRGVTRPASTRAPRVSTFSTEPGS